jgi:hypothetical protein
MLEDGMIIAVGVAFIVWNRWLTRYMRIVKIKAASKGDAVREQVALFEEILQSRGVAQVNKFLPLLGCVLILYGCISLVAD